jgi:hypothetical protein
MDVFGVHHDLIAEYEAFTSSLVAVRDPDIERHLADERERKTRWPDPELALNPTFRSGGAVASLCDEGLPHPMCQEYFRHKKHPDDPGRRTLSLHRHQREAILMADRGRSYVLTTGTGSGKSLTYIVPIVHEVLRHPIPDERPRRQPGHPDPCEDWTPCPASRPSSPRPCTQPPPSCARTRPRTAWPSGNCGNGFSPGARGRGTTGRRQCPTPRLRPAHASPRSAWTELGRHPVRSTPLAADGGRC